MNFLTKSSSSCFRNANVLFRAPYRRSFSAPTGRPHSVIYGGGSLSTPTASALIRAGTDCTVVTSNGDKIISTLNALKLTKEERRQFNKRLNIVEMPYKKGRDPEEHYQLMKRLLSFTDCLRVFYQRGTAQVPEGSNLREVIYDPTVATAEACAELSEKVSLVNFSSSTAHATPSLDNPYASVRRETDEKVQKLADGSKLRGANVALDYVVEIQPVSLTHHPRPNHGCSFLEFAKLPIQFVLAENREEADNTKVLQPIEMGQLMKAVTNPNIMNRKFSTIFGVGPRAYSQPELYEFYTELLGKPFREVLLPHAVGEWFRKHVNLAQLSYGPALVKHRAKNPEANKAFDHRPLEELAEEPLQELSEMYHNVEKLHVYSPLRAVVQRATISLLKSPEARGSLVQLLRTIPKIVLNNVKGRF